MKELYADLTIIGGGPAGLAAAIKASELGIKNIFLLERDRELGGILNQCVHDGFGLKRFEKQLSGAQYAQIFVDLLENTKVNVLTEAMVTQITKEKEIYATHKETGTVRIVSNTIILAMGCRERTRNQVRILGSRPAGVLTAGAVQRYINIYGYVPGKKAVILGSGDIGLIMARRMTLEGIGVEGVYEVMPSPGGLRRNIVQCLEDYGIPLTLSTTVIEVHGKKRLEGVTVAQVDANGRPLKDTKRYIPCDLLVLSVGLIPENELSVGADIALDPVTKGPVVDNYMMTNVPGIFAAGNVSAVFDLVDYVSETGEKAAEGAAAYLKRAGKENDVINVLSGENVSFILPQKFLKTATEGSIYLRVTKPIRNAVVEITWGNEVLYKKRHPIALPPEMLSAELRLPQLTGDITVSVREG